MKVRSACLAALIGASLAALVLAALAAADSTDPRSRPTKAAEALAKASLLRFSDLGSAWSQVDEKPTTLKIPVCPGDQPNNSDLTLNGHAEDYLQLKSEGLLIDTDVEVFATPAQVDTLFKRMMVPLLASCLQYDLEKSLGATAARIGKVTRLDLEGAGSHIADFRVSVKYNGTPVVSDFIFIAQGRTQFFVNLVGPGSLASELPPIEARIAKTLAARAAKA